MERDETSITSSGSGDYDLEEDDEDTLDEEESLAKCGEDDLNNADELRLLEEEGEMSMEELRRKYFGEAELPALPDSTDSPNSSHSNTVDDDLNQPAPSYFNEDVLNDENDDDEYEPPPEPWKKVVRVGVDCQVDSLPDCHSLESNNGTCSSSTDSNDDGDHCDPIWIPPPADICPMSKVEKYLVDCERLRHQASDASLLVSFPLSPHRKRGAFNALKELFDDENALYALFSVDYSLEKAKSKAPFGWPSLQSVNGPRRTYVEPWSAMSEEDCSRFEDGLRGHGKNFCMIRTNFLPDRTVGELVRFYYTWKKTERHDIFVEKNKQMASPTQRIESVHTTDFMGNIMDLMNGGRTDAELEAVSIIAAESTTTSNYHQSALKSQSNHLEKTTISNNIVSLASQPPQSHSQVKVEREWLAVNSNNNNSSG